MDNKPGNIRGELMGAQLSPSEMRALLFRAGSHLLARGDEPGSEYGGALLGRLFDVVDDRITLAVLADKEPEHIAVGATIYEAQSAVMLGADGDYGLAQEGLDIGRQCLEAAVLSEPVKNLE